MDSVRFDKEKHVYMIDGKKLPSVTEIINSVIQRDFYADEFQMHKGSMIHLALKLYLQGKLDENSIDERIKCRVEAGKKAIKELELRPPYVIEKHLFHKLYQYAGTPDLLTEDGILIDWKSSHNKSVIGQLGGYYLLLKENKFYVYRLYEIVLDDNGNYVVNAYQEKQCKRIFLNCLSLFNFLEKGDE